MGGKTRREYLRTIHPRYRKADRQQRRQILDEFCSNCGYNRKYAIRLLNGPPPSKRPSKTRNRRTATRYGSQLLSVLAFVWEAAGFPWSLRLKALLPLWMPWIRRRFGISTQTERQLLSISPRQMDRRLKERKLRLKRRIYGRTKPGTLLKHHIPIKTDSWDVTTPGFVEIDLVSHSGNSGEGEFIYSLNVTDIHTTWVETRAVLGKSQAHVVDALEHIRATLPFRLRGIDTDNGSEFINHHLLSYSRSHGIQFTRGRPYKKDDNAHVEQKNWTHVRKLVGYARFDTPEALTAINALYDNELRLFQNFYLPSVKLTTKTRIGSRLQRTYDAPQTPLERVIAAGALAKEVAARFCAQRDRLDPFALSRSIDEKLELIQRLANLRQSPKSPESAPLSAVPLQALEEVSRRFGIPISVRTSPGLHSQ
jgi:transposase InsO family protein